MITSEVLKHYESGGKIRCIFWGVGCYIEKAITPTYKISEELRKFKFNDDEFKRLIVESKWEIFQEPKSRDITILALFEKGATHVRNEGSPYILTITLFDLDQEKIVIGEGSFPESVKLISSLSTWKWTTDRKTWNSFKIEE